MSFGSQICLLIAGKKGADQNRMKICQKHKGRVLGAIALIATAVSTPVFAAHHAMSDNSTSVSSKAGAVAEGNRLAHLNDCYGCHGAQLTGQVVFSSWLGTKIVAPNLTRLAHRETDAQLWNAIRYGINPQGARLLGMPSNQFVKSSDEAIAALIAYLQSLPESPDTGGDTHLGLEGRAMSVTGLLPFETAAVDKTSHGPLRTPASPLALGQYITGAYCSACHGTDLSGKTMEGSPDLRVSIEHYSPTAFDKFFQTGEGQIGHGTGTMTRLIRGRFKYLTPEELHAVYAYLKSGRSGKFQGQAGGQ